MANFSIDISRWVAQTKVDMDRACRVIALELHKRIVLRTPVGNPELWKANAEAALANVQADEFNAALRLDPVNLTKGGRLKRGLKKQRRRLPQGKGYVGGRARGNWQVTIGAPASGTIERIDPSGAQAIAAAAAALASFKAGPPIYISNSVPYAYRLEYEGWSKQAPAGMVRVTVAEFSAIVEQSSVP